MAEWIVWLLCALAFIGSLVLTGLVRRYALSRRLLDIPNRRSSHAVPTPRGGGIAMVTVFYLASLVLWWIGGISGDALPAVLLAGALVVAVGCWDDLGHVPAGWRFVGHLIAGGLAVYWIGGFPSVQVGPWTVGFGLWGYAIGVVFAVWMLNLYNFMDGIDGIAGVELVSVAAVAIILLWLGGAESLAGWLLLLVASTAGFLVWNWPPARIFMGDAGSGFLGFSLAVLALASAMSGALNLWVWLILFGVFLMDATVTLVRRVWFGQTWYEAHRTHAYQHATRLCGAHLPVTLAVALMNLGWLFPLAWLASKWPSWGLLLTLGAWAPLVVLAYRFDAGVPEDKVEYARG